jgi:CHAP domain
VRRLLHFAIFIFGMSMFGAGISLMSASEATPTPPQLAALPVPPEPSMTTPLVEETPATTTTLPVKGAAAQRTTTSTTTTTTTVDTRSVAERVLAVAQGEVGKTGPYAEAGFWCARLTSWVAEQANVEGWVSSDSPARLHRMAMDEGRINAAPFPGDPVFIDLTGQNFANGYVSHVGIVESVNGESVQIIQGNGDPDPSVVSRATYAVGGGYVVAFASMEGV